MRPLGLLDLLLPATCWSCGAPAGPAAAPLCPACARALPWLGPGEALTRGRAVGRSFAPLAHAGPARELVHALKFRDAPGVARLMAAHVVLRLPRGLLAPGAVLVPVPAHQGRRRRRGYDHAEALARAIAQRTQAPVRPLLARRAAPGEHQRGRTRTGRLAGGGPEIRARGPVPAHCVLVDDVRTTGATLEACARALRAAGARRVDAIAYARVA
jgi:predicted amidophosphoribosyltransferase